jgi:hypothetical protein
VSSDPSWVTTGNRVIEVNAGAKVTVTSNLDLQAGVLLCGSIRLFGFPEPWPLTLASLLSYLMGPAVVTAF